MKSWFSSVVAAIAIVFGCSSLALAQPGGGRGGFGGGFGGPGGGFGGGGAQLLQDENVRKDLGLVDEQVQKLTSIQEKMRAEMGEMFAGMRDLGGLTDEERQARFEEMRTKATKRMEEVQKDIDLVLLPQQRDRLKQITVQSRLQRGGTSDTLASDEVAKELGITEAQKEELKKVAEEADVEMRQKIEKLREEAREKIISVLTPDQQARFKRLIGEKIEFAPPQFGGGRGGPGGPGGRGGAGGRPLTRPPAGD